MYCKMCKSEKIEVIYDDYIRDGAPGTLTPIKYKMYQCNCCKTIWHEHPSNTDYYESTDYRDKLEGNSEIDEYYRLHDFEVLDKFNYCGTTIFRNKNVADIGCGGGGFLDYLSGVAKNIIAIEPSIEYRRSLLNRGYHTYNYASEAVKDWKSSVNVITSFDVIEHVDSPLDFMKDVYELLDEGGQAIIGTPTDCPMMRTLLGKEYEQGLLYSFQHIWILSEYGLREICKQVGFTDISIKYVQRYGLANMISWLKERKPSGHIKYDFISDTMNQVYINELEKNQMSDYILVYLTK